jgi:N-formylglutamate amidohydrolase
MQVGERARRKQEPRAGASMIGELRSKTDCCRTPLSLQWGMDLPQPLDLATLTELPRDSAPPLAVAHPLVQTAPLVFASPHSGREYSAEFLASARLGALRLRRSEDSFVDELFAAAPDRGAPLLAARFPRAFCDANREAWELDPAMFAEPLPHWVNTSSARVGAGLGTIARVVASGEAIYRGKLRFTEAQARVRDCWEPFHVALNGLIEQTRRKFGVCVLIDCHSMPGSSVAPRPQADFVLGDAHGTACAPRACRLAEHVLTGMGYTVRRNDPYAGGYITRHYGRPREGVHALQIEVSRALYMDEARIERLPRFAALQSHVTTLVAALADGWRDLRPE